MIKNLLTNLFTGYLNLSNALLQGLQLTEAENFHLCSNWVIIVMTDTAPSGLQCGSMACLNPDKGSGWWVMAASWLCHMSHVNNCTSAICWLLLILDYGSNFFSVWTIFGEKWNIIAYQWIWYDSYVECGAVVFIIKERCIAIFDWSRKIAWN